MVKNPCAPQAYHSYFRSLMACNEYLDQYKFDPILRMDLVSDHSFHPTTPNRKRYESYPKISLTEQKPCLVEAY